MWNLPSSSHFRLKEELPLFTGVSPLIQTRSFAKRMKNKEFDKYLAEKRGEVYSPPVVPDDRIYYNKVHPARANIQKGSKVPKISREELKTLIESKSAVTIVDLRDTEIGDPAIPSSVKLPIKRTRNMNSDFMEGRTMSPFFKEDEKNTHTSEQQINSFKDVLNKTTDEQFESTYKFPKFKKEQLVVFYSSTGVRSDTITNFAASIGYNAKSLVGGCRLWNKFYGQ